MDTEKNKHKRKKKLKRQTDYERRDEIMMDAVLEKPNECYNRNAEDRGENNLSVKEMEKCLGLNLCKPIILNSSDNEEMEEAGNWCDDWYKEEVTKLYEQCK